MTSPYPLPRSKRETPAFVGDGRATYGPFTFSIFDVADVQATVQRSVAIGYVPEAVTATKTTSDRFSPFTVTFAPALAAGQRAIVSGRRLHERFVDVVRGGSLSGVGLELELSAQGVVLQELRRDVDVTAAAIVAEAASRKAAILAEAQAREEADAALAQSLVEEAEARQEADAGLVGRVEAETAAREASDIRLAEVIAAEAEARVAADLVLAAGLSETAALIPAAQQAADEAKAAAAQAAAYLTTAGAMLYDFALDSDPTLPGYDWSA